MSTATSQATDRSATSSTSANQGRARLVTGPLAVTFLAGFGALTSFELLLCVLPLYVAGAGSAGAGLVTGVLLLGTVAAEAGSAYLMNRFGYRASLAAGAVLLGAPALALLTRDPLWLVAVTALIRGFGFGLTTVVIGALVAGLLPPQRRGEGLGLYGVVDGIPEVLALPAGLWLAEHFGYPLVAVLAAAAALIPLAVVLLPGLPTAALEQMAGQAAGQAEDERTGTGLADEAADPGLMQALRDRGQRGPALIFAATAIGGGVIVSFLPLARGVPVGIVTAALFAQAITATVGRWWAGRSGDRHGHARLLRPALIVAAAGLAMLVWPSSPVLMITGMCLFGAGFGIMANATLALMLDRMPPAGLGTASALWNLAYDGGYGAGPAAFGLIVGRTGYPAGFGLTAALMLAALPIRIRATGAGAGAGRQGPRRRAGTSTTASYDRNDCYEKTNINASGAVASSAENTQIPATTGLGSGCLGPSSRFTLAVTSLSPAAAANVPTKTWPAVPTRTSAETSSRAGRARSAPSSASISTSSATSR